MEELRRAAARKVGMVTDAIDREIEILKQILSQSTPLIPEIEKAWVDGFSRPDQDYEEQKQDNKIRITQEYE